MYASRETDLVNTHTAGQSHGASVVSGTRSTPLAQHLVSVAVLGLLLMPGALPSKHETLTQCNLYQCSADHPSPNLKMWVRSATNR